MSNVSLQIAGHNFSIACAEGEEDHVLGLGRMIAGKLDGMPNIAGQSEARMLLYASLLLADELHDVRQAAARAAADAGEELPATLEQLAGKFENLAALLERPAKVP
jgi:cell division protein ZapA